MYLYMSECVYVFMYLYTCKSDKREREREVPGRQFSCLRECCYFFPWLIIIISCKTDFDLQRCQTHAFVLQTLASKMSQQETITIF